MTFLHSSNCSISLISAPFKIVLVLLVYLLDSLPANSVSYQVIITSLAVTKRLSSVQLEMKSHHHIDLLSYLRCYWSC